MYGHRGTFNSATAMKYNSLVHSHTVKRTDVGAGLVKPSRQGAGRERRDVQQEPCQLMTLTNYVASGAC